MAKRRFLREGGGYDARSERPARWHWHARQPRLDPGKSPLSRFFGWPAHRRYRGQPDSGRHTRLAVVVGRGSQQDTTLEHLRPPGGTHGGRRTGDESRQPVPLMPQGMRH